MIELHIDQLVLRGFDPRQRYRVADALQAELERLLNEEGLPPGWSDRPLLPEAISVAPGLRPEESGVQIARALYAQFTERR